MDPHISHPTESSTWRNNPEPTGMTIQIQADTQLDQEGEHAIPAESPTATQDKPEPKLRTPLPKFQLLLVCLIQFAEPLTASVIYPFVNQFVRATGITQGDDRKTGYYAGVIVSLPFYIQDVRSPWLASLSRTLHASGISFLCRRGSHGLSVGVAIWPLWEKNGFNTGASWPFFRDGGLWLLHSLLVHDTGTVFTRYLQWQHW